MRSCRSSREPVTETHGGSWRTARDHHRPTSRAQIPGLQATRIGTFATRTTRMAEPHRLNQNTQKGPYGARTGLQIAGFYGPVGHRCVHRPGACGHDQHVSARSKVSPAWEGSPELSDVASLYEPGWLVAGNSLSAFSVAETCVTLKRLGPRASDTNVALIAVSLST